MVKWFCPLVLRFNNLTSKDCNGRLLKYYRLPREESNSQNIGRFLVQME